MRYHARASLLIAVLLLAALAGCGEEGETSSSGTAATASTGSPILLLGIDGAEWSVLRPLLDAGELPNLSRLVDGGASGRLRSLDPRRRSPVIWATIATGRSPEEHGVAGYLSGTKGSRDISATPLSSNMWTAPAFWDIYGEAGLSVGVVGWLVTWPPWEVNGFMVSQHLQYLERFREGGRERAVVFPYELTDRLTPHVRSVDSIAEGDLERFIDPVSELGTESLTGNNETILRRAISGDESAVGALLELVKDGVPDLTCVYTRGVDEVCHGFWIYMDPATRPEFDPGDDRTVWIERQAEALHDLIPEYYRYADELVGRVLAAFPDDVTVVVCSDHGFRGPGEYGEHTPWMGEDQHGLDGVVILNGPGIRAGVTVEGATVYDIAPTMLTLVGLPVSREMSGRVLDEAFDDAFRSSHPVEYVDSYGGGRASGDAAPIESPVDDEVRERLRSLGYIQ
jgi:predicted AlkP superfamily phosphohydrolase/phosphomutase